MLKFWDFILGVCTVIFASIAYALLWVFNLVLGKIVYAWSYVYHGFKYRNLTLEEKIALYEQFTGKTDDEDSNNK